MLPLHQSNVPLEGIEPRKVLPFDCFLDSLPPLAWNPFDGLAGPSALRYVSIAAQRKAERVGFEPTTPEGVTD